MDRRAERRLARREARAASQLATRRRHTERPGAAERIETRLARRARVDQWRARLPYLSWHKDLVRPPAMARWEVAATMLVGVVAGMGVAASGVSPTGARATDLAWSLLLGVVVTAAGTLARRRVLLLAAAVATVGAWGWWSLGGLAALVLASGVVYQRDGVITGERLLHALSASLALQALVRMPGWSWMRFGTTALIAAVAIGAVVVSGWWRSPRRMRAGVAVFVAAATITLAVMGTSLWRLVDGVSLTDGTTLAADGTIESLDDLAASSEDLALAEQRLTSLQQRLDTPLLAPLRFVPIAAQQVRAVDTTIDVGLDLAGRAGDGAALVEGSELRPAPGQVDVVAVRALEAPLQGMVDSLQSAEVELASVQTPWLAGPIESANRRLADASVGALPSTELALLGVQTVPSMLGADGPRRWLIQLIDTENGTEEWQVVVADNGRLIPTDEAGGGDGVGVSIGDLSTNPDYPTAAQAAAERYEAETGRPIDGIVTMDGEGVSAFAAQGDQVSVPASALNDRISAFADSLLPSPFTMTASAGASAAEKRILVWSKAPPGQQFLEAISITGNLAPNDGTTDLLYVGMTSIENTPDLPGIERTLVYESDFDPTSGVLLTRSKLTLSNVSSGTGPVRAELTVVAGRDLQEMEVSGISNYPTEYETSGWKVWSLMIDINPGERREVEWTLTGSLTPGEYRFLWQPQLLTTPTNLTHTFRWGSGNEIRQASTIRPAGPAREVEKVRLFFSRSAPSGSP